MYGLFYMVSVVSLNLEQVELVNDYEYRIQQLEDRNRLLEQENRQVDSQDA